MTPGDSTATALAAGLKRRLATGFAWNLLGTVFNQGSTFAVSVVLANLLGRQLFGNYAILHGMIVTLTAVGQLSSGYTATKYVAEYRSVAPERAGRILSLCVTFSLVMATVVSLALATCAPFVAEGAMKEPSLRDAVAIGSIAVFFGIVSGSLVGGLNGLEAYRAGGLAGVASGTSYVLICSLTTWTWGLHGAVLGLALSAWVQFTILAIVLRRQASKRGLPLRWDGLWRERSVLVAFSLPAAIAGFTSPAALWLSSVILARQAGYPQLALYSSSNSLRVLVLFLPLVMNTVASSLLNQYRGLRDWEAYRRVFSWNLRITLALVCMGAAVLAAGGPVMLSLYGRSFREGYPVLLFLALSVIPEGLTIAVYQVVQTEAAMWTSLLTIALPRDILVVGLATALTPAHGALGLGAAYVLACCVAAAFACAVAWRLFPDRATLRRRPA